MRSSRGKRSYWLRSTRVPVQTSDLAPKMDAARSALPTLCGDFGLINMIAGVFIALSNGEKRGRFKSPISPAGCPTLRFLKGGIPRSPTAGDFALTRGVTLTANAPMVSTPILFAKNAKGGHAASPRMKNSNLQYHRHD